jgi:uncharacterized repeat protein (TIGR01451 family)
MSTSLRVPRKEAFLPVATTTPETIQTFAQDCQTPKSVFQLGETVCAKTDSVALPPSDNWWVNWIYFGIDTVVVSGGQVDSPVTVNPQLFRYTPTAVGSYKVSLTNLPNDISQTPAGFTVVNQTAPLATYQANCITPATSFNLGETVCIRVVGLSNDEFPRRRLQVGSPDGYVLQSSPVTDNSQQFTYTLPGTNTGTLASLTIEHRGTWVIALVDTADLGVRQAAPITVHKSNLLLDRVADLQLSKTLLGIPVPDPATQVTYLTYQLFITNQGPDPATNTHLFDNTLPNTTFVSFTRNTGPLAANFLPNTAFGLAEAPLNAPFARFIWDSGSKAHNALASASFAPFTGDTSLVFNCLTPGTGSAGTTTCTTSGELAPGQTATFTAVYKVNGALANGAELNDNNSASVGSDTFDQFPTSDNTAVAVTAAIPSPASCTITCPDNITVGTTSAGGAIVNFADAEIGGSTCSGSVTSSPASGFFFPIGTTTVSSTVGAGPSCAFTVTVVNVPQPTISCPANQSAVAPSGQAEASVSVGTPTFTGSLATLSSSRSDQQVVSDPYPIGVTTITWTATDQYGTVASCAQTVTVSSADAPQISCPANKTFAANAGDCQKILGVGDIGSPVTGGLNVTLSYLRGDHLALTDAYPAGQTIITWTASNAIGTASCTQTITITTTGDSTPPTLTIPADLNVTTTTCSALLDDELGVATATDNCTPAVNITRTGVPLTPSPNGSIACPTIANPARKCVENFNFPVGTTEVTYTATDAAGNQATGVQRVTVHEPTPPTFTFVPGGVGVNNDSGLCGAFVGDATLGTATVSDNCDATVIRSGVPAGNIFPVGDTVITYTAKADITVTSTQHVIVTDNTPPVVTAPGAVTLYTGSGATSCGVTVTDLNGTFGNGSATDNCSGVSAVTRGGVPTGNIFPVGPTTLTYSATDAHGNTSSANQLVTVVDNTPPTISCPANVTVYLPLNSTATSTVVNYPAATASDNCGSVGITYSQNSGTVFPVGPTTVTATATDSHNNSSSCQFTVTVLYDFTGFFSPVGNLPALNSVNAGRAIPVKFSLSGNKGLNIFAAGNPYSVSLNCNTSDPGVDITETTTAGGSSLSFGGDQYNYVWKTESSWAGTCRELVVTLNDGSVHVAKFKFK